MTKKDYGLKFLDMIEEIYANIDANPSVENINNAAFVAEFWKDMSAAIPTYIRATPEVKKIMRNALENQRQIVKGLKNV